MTRHDEPLSTVEVVPLVPSGDHTPRSTASSTTGLMTARSAGPPAEASSQSRSQRPSSLLAVAGERRIAGDAPPAPLYWISQIPIDTVRAARGFVHGRFPYAGPNRETRHLRWPASENLHHPSR